VLALFKQSGRTGLCVDSADGRSVVRDTASAPANVAPAAGGTRDVAFLDPVAKSEG